MRRPQQASRVFDPTPTAQRPARRSAPAWALAAVLGLGALGCDFFQELESTAQDETSTGGEGTGDEASETGETGDSGPCEAIDDRCDSQDVLHSCCGVCACA